MNEGMENASPLFESLLVRLDNLYQELDKKVIVTREKVLKLTVCVSEPPQKSDESLSKTPETIIEKLNSLASRLESTSNHLATTLRTLDTLI